VVTVHAPDDTTDWKPKGDQQLHKVCAPSMEEFKKWEWIKFDLFDRDPAGPDSHWGDKDDHLATSWHKIDNYGLEYVSKGKCADNSMECTNTEITFSNAGCDSGMVLADPANSQKEIASQTCYIEGVPKDWPKNLFE